ncbi:MAG TPA: LuxR C-terminal-related transcriptional regulator [Solirubrobacter sp.]|nr:LuxR C-terminal-related transcriptional regulator [Solirubrobacter sp.]
MSAAVLVESLPAPSHRPDDVFGALVPPPLRPVVRRPRLVTPLLAPDGPPFVVVVAPAGYGKTTLLCEWCARDPRPFGWLTLHRGHDEPRALLRSIAGAVEAATAHADGSGAVLVIDDVQMPRTAPARDALAAIGRQPPPGLTIVLASRTEPPLPVARLRMQGMLTELRAGDLAMTRAEAGSLLRAAGAPLDGAPLDALVRRTEGWPAGLALAALSCAEHGGGIGRLGAEYVRDEVLAPLSADEARFVLRTSVLDVLTGPLCDALLERTGSAAMLAALARAGFPLVALDHTGERFRHHRLLGEVLRADLHRDDPRLERELHTRACAWHADAGDGERALRHALAAGDVARAAGLLWNGVADAVACGGAATVEHRLQLFSSAQIASEPLLAAAAAGAQLAHGRGDLAEHWTLAATCARTGTSAARGAVTALHAALGHDGLARMAADSVCAAELLAPDSPGQALCALLAGVAAQLTGDRAQARRRLEDGARRAAVAAPQLHALCLAQLALLALDEHDTEEAARASTRARAQIARHGLARLETSCLVLAVSALVRAQRGSVEGAGADAGAAAALLERMVDVAPWYELEVQLALARTALRLGDVNVTRARLATARRIAARVPEATAATASLDAAERDLECACGTRARATASLTMAELRILHFLPTHLSFREIAERTYVSPNTVKTQANAVYRKLDVRSRSEAVACARELGLLDA